MLALVWIAIIAFCIIMYVILDGFTLGTGMMLPFLKPHERDIAMSVILPTWDGNQTWLVLGMASLYGAFPLAFSILLPLFYIPLLIMVIALLARGVAFEFRLKSNTGKNKWDILFVCASLGITLVQGYILGTFIQGLSSQGEHWQLTHPFSFFALLTAVSLVSGYALLGSTRLMLKTTGTLVTKMHRISLTLTLTLVLAIFLVSIVTPYVYPLVQARWFNLHTLPLLAILPFITIITFIGLLYALQRRMEKLPYWLAIILFLCPYIGFIISLYPYLIPYKLTLWQVASPNSSLRFLLIGALIMLPILLFYTGYAYHIFRGKVDKKLHY